MLLRPDRRRACGALLCAVPAVLLGLVLAAPLSAEATGLASNLMIAALVMWMPLVAAARRHRREGSAAWRGWALLSASVLSWGLGQVVWAWYEEVLHQQLPLPSLADAGFLGFPVLAVAGLLLLRGEGPGRGLRDLLDGLLVASSVGLLSWATVLGVVFRADADGALAFGVALAYPLGDLVLGVLVLLAVSRATAASRASLALVGLGSAVLVVGDSAFLLGLHEGWYASGSLVDLTWVTGFGLLGLAGWYEATSPGAVDAGGLPGRARALLPYLALVPALVLVVVPELFVTHPDRVVLVVSGILVALLMLRQLVAVNENTRLLGELAAREEQLRAQAFADPLTGLANRALFAERLTHAVALARRDLRPLAVLYVDLDGFKSVNDVHGHAEGDRLLVAVAERLRAAAGPADTVARLGGDEFAVLLEGGHEEAGDVAARVVGCMASPFVLGAGTVSVSASVGAAELRGERCMDADPDALLRHADEAMYAAKRCGKDTWSLHDGDRRAAATGGSSPTA